MGPAVWCVPARVRAALMRAGTMYTAHNAQPYIAVWDAGSQKRTADRLPLDSKHLSVTSLNATKKSDHLLCAVRGATLAHAPVMSRRALRAAASRCLTCGSSPFRACR